MDLGTAITGIGMLALAIVPIIYISSLYKNRDQKIISELKDLATEKDSEISQYDVHSNFAIGVSKTKNYVFFVQKPNGEDEYLKYVIPLNEVDKCDLQIAKRTVKLSNTTSTVIDKIELVFDGKTKGERAYDWLLYDTDVSLQPDNEISIGNKWASVVNRLIA